MSVPRLLTRVRDALRATLPLGLRVDVEPLDPSAPTFTITIRAAEGEHRFVAGWAGEGWPADVDLLTRLAGGRLDVVVAQAVSVGARASLADSGIGWVDESGAANFSIPSGLVVVRDGVDRSRPIGNGVGWSRSTVAVAEAALSGIDPRVDQIQQATGLSRGATANALCRLEGLGLLERDNARGPGSARRVADPSALLDQYAIAVGALNRKAPVVLLHRLWRDPLAALAGDLCLSLESAKVGWAVTGAAAAALLAPYLSNLNIVDLYVDDDLLHDPALLADTLSARIVERGQRIEVRPFPNRITATNAAIVDGIRCAPPARVYADLLAKGGRSAEAAQHLREVLHVGASA